MKPDDRVLKQEVIIGILWLRGWPPATSQASSPDSIKCKISIIHTGVMLCTVSSLAQKRKKHCETAKRKLERTQVMLGWTSDGSRVAGARRNTIFIPMHRKTKKDRSMICRTLPVVTRRGN